MDVDLASDLDSEEVKKALQEKLPEGADIGSFTKHLLEGVYAGREAKRQKQI